MKNLSLAKNLNFMRLSSFENLNEVGSIVQLIAHSPYNLTLSNISVTNVSSSRNTFGFSALSIVQGYSSRINISDNRFSNLNSSNSDGLILSVNGANLTSTNFLTIVNFQRNTMRNILPSNQLFAPKTFKTRGLGIFMN